MFVKGATVWDAELNQLNPTKNMDKFYVLQLLVTPSSNAYYLFLHWGRTGTVGQVRAERFRSLSKAQSAFQNKFAAKAGFAWSARNTHKPLPNKYNYVQKNYARARPKSIRWEYDLINDPNGKADGWYSYDGDAHTYGTATSHMEDYYAQYQRNPWLNVRFVDSGSFVYRVDFSAMTQQNTVSHKIRKIRRAT